MKLLGGVTLNHLSWAALGGGRQQAGSVACSVLHEERM